MPISNNNFLFYFIIFTLAIKVSVSSEHSPRFSIRLPGSSYLMDWEDDGEEDLASSKLGYFVGRGREYNIFDSPSKNSNRSYRGGDSRDNLPDDEFLERYRRYFQRPSYKQNSSRKNSPMIMQQIQNWWATSISPKLESMPKIVCRVEPTTTLKLRKTFRPLKTIVRVGADFNTQLGVWQFKSSWEEPIIGGKLTLIGNELHVTKSWRLYVGT